MVPESFLGANVCPKIVTGCHLIAGSTSSKYTLAKRWREPGDRDAAHKLVTSHLRLVAKIAMGYRGYGLPISEVISEGNVGLMQAVKRFEPEKGFRLATYAMWWMALAAARWAL